MEMSMALFNILVGKIHGRFPDQLPKVIEKTPSTSHPSKMMDVYPLTLPITALRSGDHPRGDCNWCSCDHGNWDDRSKGWSWNHCITPGLRSSDFFGGRGKMEPWLQKIAPKISHIQKSELGAEEFCLLSKPRAKSVVKPRCFLFHLLGSNEFSLQSIWWNRCSTWGLG